MVNGGKIVSFLFFFLLLLSIAYAGTTTFNLYDYPDSIAAATKSYQLKSIAIVQGVILSILCTFLLILLMVQFTFIDRRNDPNWINFTSFLRTIFDFGFIVVLRYFFQKYTHENNEDGDFWLVSLLPWVGVQVGINTIAALFMRKGLIEFLGIFSTGMANLLFFAQNWRNGDYIVGLSTAYSIVAGLVGALLYLYPIAAGNAAAAH